MRKLLTAGLLTLPIAVGCQTTGGICDCAPIPGDSTGYNPHVTYHATCPGSVPPPPPPAVPTVPVSTNIKGGSGSFEPIGPPRPLTESKR